MNITEYIATQKNQLQSDYITKLKQLKGLLNSTPEKYDVLHYERYDALHNCILPPERKHLQCTCGNNKFYYYDYGYICSKCFLDWRCYKGCSFIPFNEQIIWRGIEIVAE